MSFDDIQSSLDEINRNGDNIESISDFNSLTNAFRFLRNLCGTNPDAQNEILKNDNPLLTTKKILMDIMTHEMNEQRLLCLQVGLQFLANLIVNNKKNQEIVWSTCQELFDHGLKFNNTKVQNCCSMILYNIFLGKPEYTNELKHPYEDLILLTMQENTSEFSLFTIEFFVLKSNYIEKFYDELKPECRLIILEVIKNLVTEQHNHNLKPEVIKFFSDQFTKKSDNILKTSESYANSLDPVEIVKILDLLVAFSSDDKQCYLDVIQKDTSLLINCIMLLKNIHSLSKQEGNNFSMITKISEYQNVESDTSVLEHPVFGFKCSLVRLIGNLCWKNVSNQNQVRKLECIPVLLDCCNIDGRNPFIIQWAILAIRNVCENNSENQKMIAGMSKEGKIDAARLREIGIVLNTESSGDSICIAPLELNKN